MNREAQGARIPRATWLLATMAFALLLLAAPAHAAFPGANGKILFESPRDDPTWPRCSPCNVEIYSMNSDGSGIARLTDNPAVDNFASWSPDGKKIVFRRFVESSGGLSDIYVMNADGSDETPLGSGSTPSWSPDGAKIAFSAPPPSNSAHGSEIYLMNADGTGITQITHDTNANDIVPAFSPDGRKIAFASDRSCPAGGFCADVEIWVMNADGTGLSELTTSPASLGADWSPDGSRIAFWSNRTGTTAVWAMNADGSDQAELTDGAFPSWSPDGAKITYTDDLANGDDIFVMNPDGSGVTRLTDTTPPNDRPNWQPIPINGYPRPKGATPLRASLVVAYQQCTASKANRQHGGSLFAHSCYPATSNSQSSKYLTVGTDDAWPGTVPKSLGSLRLDVETSPPEDVRIAFSISDVRCKGANAVPSLCGNVNTDNANVPDYTGELQATTSLRITDKDSTPSPDGTTGAATVEDMPLAFAVPCTALPDTTVGSSCTLTTTANTLVPGAVPDGLRSNWQLGQIQVYDGGADGQASSADNTLFMDEGIFVP